MIKIGQHIIHFEQLPSTNTHAAQLLSEGRPVEGTVITTDDQYAGKGQLANKWESEPYKNISLSTILYPNFLDVERQFYFNQAISLAVFHTIDEYTPRRVHIKWPNDIYIDDNKVAGILIQNQLQGKKLSTSIVGIGINVNQDEFVSDAPNPISIRNATGHSVDLGDIKQSLVDNITTQYHALRLGAYKSLSDQYHQVLYRKGELHRFATQAGQEVSGTILGVGGRGLLQVLIEGQTYEFGFKEIKYL